MKVRLGIPVSDVGVAEVVLKRQLPHYRYAIRNGRVHRFLVVSGDGLGAAIVVALGKNIKVFAGFGNEWLHAGWMLAMLWGFLAAGGMVVRCVQPGAGVSDVGGLLATLAVAAGLEFGRRQSLPLVREVVACLEKGLS
jgi:hypothetical protein